MVVQDLLPGSLPARSQFHQYTREQELLLHLQACHLHPTAISRESQAWPHLPRKGNDKVRRNSQCFLCPTALRGRWWGWDRDSFTYSASQ